METLNRYQRMLRSLAIMLLVLSGIKSQAQFDCTILPGDTTVCYGQSIYLYTQFADTMNYYWEPNGETGVIIEVEVTDTITYILKVYNKDSTFFCTDTVTISIYPKMVVEFEQINKGCPDECKAQVVARATGGVSPIRYQWGAAVAPNDSSLALGLCTDEYYTVFVSDTVCIFDTNFLVEGYHMPEVVVTILPDTLYETDPRAQLSFENKSSDTIPLTNWTWIFPDSSTTNQLSPEFVFVDSLSTVQFIYTTIDGCVDTITSEVIVKSFELTLYNVFTPNGDGVNDTWEIPLLDRYISNELVVFNRWGQRVFEKNNYDNSWDGGTLPDGVYFYILRCQGYWKEDIYRGSVSIYGSRY